MKRAAIFRQRRTALFKISAVVYYEVLTRKVVLVALGQLMLDDGMIARKQVLCVFDVFEVDGGDKIN